MWACTDLCGKHLVCDSRCCLFPEKWLGVTVQGSCVVELDLSLNKLKGELPDELGELTALVKLVLWGNDGITSVLS